MTRSHPSLIRTVRLAQRPSLARPAALVGLLLLSAVSNSYGQQAVLPPPRRESADSEAEQVPESLEQLFASIDEKEIESAAPPRKYMVKQGEKEPRQLFKADPKLLANQFAAYAELVRKVEKPRIPAGFNFLGGDRREIVGETSAEMILHDEANRPPEVLMKLLMPSGTSTVFTGQQIIVPRAGFRGGPGLSSSEYFKLLLQQCPQSVSPPEPLVNFLTGSDADRDVLRDFSHPTPSSPRGAESSWQVTAFARTESEAEQRLAAILILLDNGLCRPLQRFCLAEGKKSLAAVRANYKPLNALKQKRRELQAELTKPSEISTDILTQLKAQKIMTAVEVAGLEARVKACDEMLKDPKRLEIATLQSISDMKVKAEIERVGLKEKLEHINGFIAEGDARSAASRRLRELEPPLRDVRKKIFEDEQRAEAFGKLVSLYAPLELRDNEITISLIEWTN